jgi:hypothetical protein
MASPGAQYVIEVVKNRRSLLVFGHKYLAVVLNRIDELAMAASAGLNMEELGGGIPLTKS